MSAPLVRIGDFCATGSGGTPSRTKPEYFEGNIPWIKSGDLRENIVVNATEFITEAAVKNSSAKHVAKGSILLAMYGATVGRMALLGIDATTNQAVCNITPDSNLAFTKYVYYALLNKVPEFLESAVGGAQPNISQGIIRDTLIPLPPLAEQKRIAAILDKADSIRRKRQQAITLADEFLRSVFLDMFGDPVTNPKGWEIKKLSDMATITTGNTPSREVAEFYGDYIEWIKSDNINTPSHFLTNATEFLSKKGCDVGRKVPSGSTLVTCIAGSFDCIGNAAYANREVAFNQQINALTPKENVNSWFLYALIIFSKKIIQTASTNSMKGMISKGRMEEIQLICPPPEFQNKFQDIFLRCQASQSSVFSSELELNKFFASLSQKAFSGNL